MENLNVPLRQTENDSAEFQQKACWNPKPVVKHQSKTRCGVLPFSANVVFMSLLGYFIYSFSSLPLWFACKPEFELHSTRWVRGGFTLVTSITELKDNPDSVFLSVFWRLSLVRLMEQIHYTSLLNVTIHTDSENQFFSLMHLMFACSRLKTPPAVFVINM